MFFSGKNKKIFYYAAYFVLISLVFLFYGFPSKAVQAYIQSLAEDKITETDFLLGKVSPSLPLGLKLHQPELAPKQNREGLRLKADTITIQPEPWSFIKGGKVYRFQSRIYDGTVKGSIDFVEKKTGPPYSLFLTLNDLQFKSSQLLPGLERDLEGQLRGTVQYEARSGDIYDGTGEAELKLSGGKVDVTLPLLAVDTLEFDQLTVKCELKNTRLNLVRLEFRGPDLNASLNGSISLNRQFFKSRLNLRGEIEPLPGLLRQLNDSPSTLEILKRRLKGGKLTFTVSGALDDPRMRIN